MQNFKKCIGAKNKLDRDLRANISFHLDKKNRDLLTHLEELLKNTYISPI